MNPRHNYLRFPAFSSFSRYSVLPATLFALTALTTAGCGGGGGGGTASATQTGGTGSAAQTRQLSLSLTAQGTRGSVPVAFQVTGDGERVAAVTAAGASVTAEESDTVQLVAPPSYADRQFVGWRQAGENLSTLPTLRFTAASLAADGAIEATYAPQAVPASGFTPAYGNPAFPRWKQFPLKVYLDGSVTGAANKQASVAEGLNRWVNASGGLVSYELVTDPAQAQVTVSLGALPAGSAGKCDTVWDSRGFLKSAAITLNPPVADGVTQVTTQNLATLAAHEFGHALGMTGTESNIGHSPEATDTMYFSGNSQTGVITARDINTLANIYPDLFTGNGGRAQSVGTRTISGVADADGLYHGHSF